ncbi:MAG: hypothetical protein GY719_22290 [bacterium]|nr:hypothetical protein [bacterium]
MKKARRMWSLVLPGVLWLGACGEKGPVDSADLAAAALPSWLAELPETAVEAAPGVRVWAVVPERGNEGARLATYRLVAASGTEAELLDDLGTRFEGVPGALVHPLSDLPEAELAAGVAVLADRWDADKLVGRVARIEGGEVEVVFDWNGSTATAAMDTVVPVPVAGGSRILRWVAYPSADGGTWHRGLCFAESDERLWINDDGGNVQMVARDSIRLLEDLGRGELQTGAEVTAYSWGHGYRRGVIEEVLEPGLRFSVKTEDGETRAFFFDALTTAF